MKLKLGNAFVYPSARLVAETSEQVVLQVNGLLCDLWAARVRAALEGLPEVSRARVDLATGRVEVALSQASESDGLVEAVEGKVVLRPLRRLLALLGSGHRHGDQRLEAGD